MKDPLGLRALVAIMRIGRLFETLFKARLPDKLTLNHFAVLDELASRPGGASPTNLAEIIDVSKGTMTGYLRFLKKKGLISIEKSLEDRRGKNLQLTEAGEDARMRCVEAVAKMLSEHADAPTSEALKTVIQALEAIRRVLEAERAA